MGYGLLIILYGWKSPIQEGGGVWLFRISWHWKNDHAFSQAFQSDEVQQSWTPASSRVCSLRWPPESRACHTSGRARDPGTPWPTSLSSSLGKWRPGRTSWKPSPALSSLHPCCVDSYSLSSVSFISVFIIAKAFHFHQHILLLFF